MKFTNLITILANFLFICGAVLFVGPSFIFGIAHQAHAQIMGQGMTQPNNVNTAVTNTSDTVVLIVEDAAGMTDKAYQPNPINITVGDTIKWINHDSEMHTVTSGSGYGDPNEGKEFDSGPLIQGGLFTHAFKTVGVFNYFCGPHPWMVAKVIVK